MNKFHVAYIIVFIMFVSVIFSAVAGVYLQGLSITLSALLIPLIVSGFLVYALKDWHLCNAQ